jgi:ribosomal protein L20
MTQPEPTNLKCLRKVNLLAVAVKPAVSLSNSKLQTLIKVPRRAFRELWLALVEKWIIGQWMLALQAIMPLKEVLLVTARLKLAHLDIKDLMSGLPATEQQTLAQLAFRVLA